MENKKPRKPAAPDYEKAKQAFEEFLKTVAALRHPETGCPWDNEQTHQSLVKYMLEEAYEASEVMDSISEDEGGLELCGELGDVLLQVVLNSQLAVDEGRFSIVDVVESINSKMRRRHPHVFGSEEEKKDRDKGAIKRNWQKIKAKERGDTSFDAKGYFEKAKVAKVRPALLQSFKIGEVASRIEFDWNDAGEVFAQFKSEFLELERAFEAYEKEPKKSVSNNTSVDGSSHDTLKTNLKNEIGDVFFSLSQFCRHLGLNPEMMAERGNSKFLARFESVEKLAGEKGIGVEKATRDQLESLWQQAKLDTSYG